MKKNSSTNKYMRSYLEIHIHMRLYECSKYSTYVVFMQKSRYVEVDHRRRIILK